MPTHSFFFKFIIIVLNLQINNQVIKKNCTNEFEYLKFKKTLKKF